MRNGLTTVNITVYGTAFTITKAFNLIETKDYGKMTHKSCTALRAIATATSILHLLKLLSSRLQPDLNVLHIRLQ